MQKHFNAHISTVNKIYLFKPDLQTKLEMHFYSKQGDSKPKPSCVWDWGHTCPRGHEQGLTWGESHLYVWQGADVKTLSLSL